MSVVELVNNPEPSVSTHSWTVQGLSQLTRENKVSSLPFWVPNSTMKTHQFHLVLLKGLVPAPNPADDAFGLVLEVVPPPTDPVKNESAAASFPGGCHVTVRVVNHTEARTGDIVASQTVLIDEANSQIGFGELLPAAAARSSAFLSGEPPEITFIVTIHTGVSVFAQQITSSVSSLWSTLTSSVAKIVDTGVQVYHEGRREFEEAITLPVQAAQPAAPAVTPSPAPWEVAPPKWVNRAQAWHDLVFEKAVNDDGFFLYGPERPITEDERQLLLQSNFNYRMLLELYNEFNYDRDVHEGLLASTALRLQRYHLVPARIKEGLFWANYFWKVACLATCDDDAQVRVLLTVLNAPPAVEPNRPDLTVKGLSDDEAMTCATDAQEAGDLLLEYLSDENNEENIFLMETTAHTCEDHVKRLDVLFCRTDLTQNTLLVIGTTLRRLRERIAKYRELVKRKEEASTMKGKETSQTLSPSAPNTSLAVSQHHPQNSLSAAHASLPPPTPQAEEAQNAPTDRTPPKSPASAPSQAPLDASPEPTVPAKAQTQCSPPTEAAAPNDHPSRAGSGSAAAVTFPKMPWEEDEEDAP